MDGSAVRNGHLSQSSDRGNNRAPTILIVEDETLIRVLLADRLQECGFHVVEAANAAQALEIIEAGDPPIDLGFSDVVMPGKMDGIGLARWIRRNYPEVPVILTSADAEKGLLTSEPFLPKPYDIEEAVERIRTAIDD